MGGGGGGGASVMGLITSQDRASVMGLITSQDRVMGANHSKASIISCLTMWV